MNIYGNLKTDNNETYILSSEINKIGRNPLTNIIVLNHQSISKDHALIEFSPNGSVSISDLNSSNGTFVNGEKIPSNLKYNLNQGDIIRFGKDPTIFTFNNLPFSGNNSNNNFYNNNNSNFNDCNCNQKNNNNVSQRNNLQSQVFYKQKQLENVSLSYTQLSDEYKKLNAKHTALMHYASDLQKKNDILEYEIREQNYKIEKLQNTELGKILIEKESIIKILQNENDFYNKELQKIKNSFNSNSLSNQLDMIINEYLMQIGKLKRENEEYKSMFHNSDRKWNELIKINDSLQLQINTINKHWSDDSMKYNELLNENDRKLNEALNQIPLCYDKFNIDKEQAAIYLVNQVNLYLNEKQNLLNEIADLNRKIVDLINENDKLKNEITIIESKFSNYDMKELMERNLELEDALIQLEKANDVEKKIDYEDTIKRLNKEINQKEQIIIELKEKLVKSMHNSNLFFDEKEVVNSISQALRNRDNQIEQLKNELNERKKNDNLNYTDSNFKNYSNTLK